MPTGSRTRKNAQGHVIRREQQRTASDREREEKLLVSADGPAVDVRPPGRRIPIPDDFPDEVWFDSISNGQLVDYAITGISLAFE